MWEYYLLKAQEPPDVTSNIGLYVSLTCFFCLKLINIKTNIISISLCLFQIPKLKTVALK